MHDIIFDRIRNQVQGIPAMQPMRIEHPPLIENPPVSREELHALFLELFKEPEPPAIIIESVPLVHFPHLWSFVEWYEPNREKFTEAQRVPLDTLIQTRDMVNTGCGCRRASRETAANAYFKDFWLNNQTTDLMPAVLKNVGSEKIQFAHFLTYPA